jgi:hypothetical protein
MNNRTQLTAQEANLKALKYRELADAKTRPEDRMMFEHMAEVWERYAKGIGK